MLGGPFGPPSFFREKVMEKKPDRTRRNPRDPGPDRTRGWTPAEGGSGTERGPVAAALARGGADSEPRATG